MTNKNNSVDRFSNRVYNYIKYRPSYPYQIIEFLKEEINLNPSNIVADIGSGTGISAYNFLKNGNQVIGIEPNEDMRKASDEYLQEFSNFKSLNGTSDNTNLADNSVDLVIASQAFHWFDVDKSKSEFIRILKPDSYVVLIWNEMDFSKPFMAEYEKLLIKYGTDYQKVRQSNIDQPIFNSFFKSYKVENFYNVQVFDYQSLEGRLLSSSYIPLDEVIKSLMLVDLKKIFAEYQKDGHINFEYNTKVYYGQL